MTRLRCFACGLAVLALAAAASAEDDAKYYALRMGGKKVGHVKRIRKVAGDKVTSVESMKLTMSRMGTAMTIRTIETCVETCKGKPLSFQSVQDLGIMAMKITGKINPDGQLTVTTAGAGAPQEKKMPWPKGAVLAEGMLLQQKAKGLKPGTSYTVKTFVPSLLAVLEAKVTVGQKQDVDVLGRVVKLTAIGAVLQAPTGTVTTTEYVNDDFETLKVVMPMLGMNLELLACDKAFALSPDDVMDFLTKLLVPSPTPLKAVASAKAITYHLEPTTPGKLELPALDNQAVRDGAAGVKIVKVQPVAAPKGASFPYKGSDPAARQALKRTRFLECDSKKVMAAARKAVGDTKDAAEAARRICAFVRKHISAKDLSVGYATALETLESKQGDCSEHAVLATAMCRSVGIPARVVCGMTYIRRFGGKGDVFGPHAWVEVLIGGKWVGLDAAMESGFDAGHIALSVGSGSPEDFFGMLSTLGCFKITKLQVQP